MSKITFVNKSNLYPVVDEEKQITAENVNEIKNSVNTLYDALDNLPSGGGDVSGPASSVNNNIAVFDGLTGKIIKDSGVNTGSFIPSTRTVNGKSLSSDISLTYSDVGAAPTLGANDNYVTDAEKLALHSHSNLVALNAVAGTNTGDDTACDQPLNGYSGWGYITEGTPIKDAIALLEALMVSPISVAPNSNMNAWHIYGTTHKGFYIISKLHGQSGNGDAPYYGIRYVIETNTSDNLAITVDAAVPGNSPHVIHIKLANTTAAKNTALLVKSAIEATPAANSLVYIVLLNDGTGTVTTQPITSLAGGVYSDPGFESQEIVDEQHNIWKCVKVNNEEYYWAPHGFPANNIEYPAYLLNGKLVWKIRITSFGALPNNTTKSVTHGIVMDSIVSYTAMVVGAQSVQNMTDYSTSGFVRGWVSRESLAVSTNFNSSGSTGIFEIYYTKPY